MDISTLYKQGREVSTSEQIVRKQLLSMLLLRVILYTLLLIISNFLHDERFSFIIGPSNLFLFFVAAIYLITALSAGLLLTHKGSYREFGFIQTLLDTCLVTILVFFSGVSHSSFTTVYFFPIVAAGLILPTKGGLVAAASASLQYATILFLELYRIYPPGLEHFIYYSETNLTGGLNQFAVHGLTFFLAALLSALFGLRLQKAELQLSTSLKNFDRLAILYKQIFDNISTGIITVDGETRVTSANNAAEKITGRRATSLVGKDIFTIFPTMSLVKTNHRLTADFVRDDGRQLRIGYSHMVIQRSKSDPRYAEPTHKIITLRDISELEKLERQVRQAEKLAAIGMMSASIAHDFRNPLTAISGSAQLLAEEFSRGNSSNHTNFELSNIIIRESNRLITTIAEFLSFSRPERVVYEWFSLKNCVDEVLQVLHAGDGFPGSAEITFDFDRNLAVWGDEKQLFTVFSHLMQNSIPFCPPGKERLCIVAKEELRREDNKEMLSISIADNGTGIEEKQMEQIFEPFYSNRPDGTGLGLAIVRQIIGEHRGTIGIDNLGLDNQSAGKGARFSIRLPMP